MATLEELRAARAAQANALTDISVQGPRTGSQGKLFELRAARARDMQGGPTVNNAAAMEMQRIANRPADDRSRATTDIEASVTGDARLQGAPESMVYDSRTGQMVDTALTAERMGPLQGANAQYLQSTPLVGSYVDEAMGGLDALFNDRNPALATETMRQSRQQFQDSNPKTALGIGVGSGIIGSLPAAVIAGPAIAANAPATLLGKAAYGAALGAPALAAEGAVYGYGAGDNGDRAASAGTGALIGGVSGLALGAVSPFAAQLAAKGWRGIRSMAARAPVSRVANDLGISPEAARFLNETLGDIDLPNAANKMNRSGPDAMLADASIGASQQLDNALQNSGGFHEVVSGRVNDRIVAAGDRLTRSLDDILGVPEGRVTAQANIRAGTRSARNEAYSEAYAAPIDYSSAEGRRIEAVLGNLPQNRVNSAIREANELMAVDAAENGTRATSQIIARLDDAGAVVFDELPNATQLDYIKRGFDRLVEAGRDSTTGKLSPDALLASRAARLVRDSHAAANPAYRTALDTAADSINRENATEFGYNLLNNRIRRESVLSELDGMPGGERKAMMQGMRSYIDDIMANVGRVASDPNVETRQVRTLVNRVTTPANKAKVTALIGRGNAERLFGWVDDAAAALELRAALAQNSKTAIRQASNSAADVIVGPTIAENARALRPVATASDIMQSLTGGPVSEAVLGRKQALFAEIADVLTRSGDGQAAQALAVLRRLSVDQPATEAQARMIGNAFTAAIDAGAYSELRGAANGAR